MTGDPLTWLKLHAAWGRRYTGLWFVVGARYAFITEQGWHLYMSNLHHDLLNGLGVIFVLAAAWPVARRFGLAYSVFILINILPPIASGRAAVGGQVLGGALSGVSVVGAGRAVGESRGMDRVVRRGSGVERGHVLHVAPAVLSVPTSVRRPGSAANRQI